MAKIQRVAYTPEPGLPPVGQAASLALAIMKKAKVARWADLNSEVPYVVALHPGQLDLLRSHLDVISYLGNKLTGDDSTATVGLQLCLECGRWVLLSKAASKVCPLTLYCTGEQVKVSAAPRSGTLPVPEDGRVSPADEKLDVAPPADEAPQTLDLG